MDERKKWEGGKEEGLYVLKADVERKEGKIFVGGDGGESLIWRGKREGN